MKKALFLLVFVLCTVFTVGAQPSDYTKMTAAESSSVVQSIKNHSGKMNSLKVDFKQEKTTKALKQKAVSQGNMSYKKGGFLRWSYTSPSAYSIIVNERGAFLKNSKGSTANKALGEMSGMIARTISGEGLVSNKDFSVTFYKKKDYAAYLVPTSKRLQSLYKSFEVYLNPSTYLATKVKLVEKNGSVTVIYFSNHKTNVTFSANEFKE